MLQLMSQSTIDVTGKPAHTNYLAGCADEIFFERQGDFLGRHVKILLRVG